MNESDSPAQAMAPRVLPALLDSWTGLPVRGLFLDRLEQALLGATRGGAAFAVMIMEFKFSGEAAGSGAPEKMTRSPSKSRNGSPAQRANRTRSRASATGILPASCSERRPRMASGSSQRRSPPRCARRCRSTAARPDRISYGMALYPDNGVDSKALLRNAQRGIEQARRTADGIEIFPDAAPAAGNELPPAFLRFKDALDNHELLPHYQPKVDLATGAVTGRRSAGAVAEPPVRAAHARPVHGGGERTSAISTISLAILELALDQAALWSAKGIELPIAVNFSARVLGENDSAKRIIHAVERRGSNPSVRCWTWTWGADIRTVPGSRGPERVADRRHPHRHRRVRFHPGIAARSAGRRHFRHQDRPRVRDASRSRQPRCRHREIDRGPGERTRGGGRRNRHRTARHLDHADRTGLRLRSGFRHRPSDQRSGAGQWLEHWKASRRQGPAARRNFTTLSSCPSDSGIRSGTVGERDQILTVSMRISGICQEQAGRYGPLSRRHDRIIPASTARHPIPGFPTQSRAAARCRVGPRAICSPGGIFGASAARGTQASHDGAEDTENEMSGEDLMTDTVKYLLDEARIPKPGTTSWPTCPRRRRRCCIPARCSRSGPTTWRRCSRWR